MAIWNTTLKLKAFKSKDAGFSLFELLVVLLIIALLATLVAPRLLSYIGRAREDVAQAQMSNLVTSLELYYLDVGRFPTEEQGLAALLSVPVDEEGDPINGWRGPYLDNEDGLKDPWDNLYVYEYDAEADRVRVTSYGLDGEPGGDGENSDIVAQ